MTRALQLQLEQQYSNTYSTKYLKAQFEEQGMYYIVEDMAKELMEFVKTCDVPDDRPDLAEVCGFFMNHDVEKILWKMVSIVLIKQSMTVAALAGVVFHSIKLENSHRRFLAIEFLLNMLNDCPLIHSVITKGEECIFNANNELPQGIKEHMSAQGYPLPMLTRPVAKDNSSIGYLSFNESVIAGGALKHHDYNIVLSNINRANSVAYTSETRLNQLVQFKFDPTPKVKDNGLEETVEDIAKRHESFLLMAVSLPIKEQILVDQGNKYHLAHRVDNRLRRYAKGHEFNYQSHKFIKSKVQFYAGELVTGEW